MVNSQLLLSFSRVLIFRSKKMLEEAQSSREPERTYISVSILSEQEKRKSEREKVFRTWLVPSHGRSTDKWHAILPNDPREQQQQQQLQQKSTPPHKRNSSLALARCYKVPSNHPPINVLLADGFANPAISYVYNLYGPKNCVTIQPPGPRSLRKAPNRTWEP